MCQQPEGRNERDPQARGDPGCGCSRIQRFGGLPTRIGRSRVFGVSAAISSTPLIEAHHGRIVKRTGDGSIIEFRSVVDAVRCAIEIQNGLIDRNAGVPEDRQINSASGFMSETSSRKATAI